MSRDVEGVEGKKEAVPITVFVQRKKNTKNTKTLLGGGALSIVRGFSLLAWSFGYLTLAKSEG